MLSVPSLYTGLYQPRDDRDHNNVVETPNYRKFEREYTADKILGKGGFGLVFQGMYIRVCGTYGSRPVRSSLGCKQCCKQQRETHKHCCKSYIINLLIS